MQKNVASQKWIVYAFDETDNTPKTGDAANITGNLRIDGGAANAIDDTNPTELEDGYYVFDITQAESNGNLILNCPESSTANIQVIGVPGAVWTRPPNFQAMGIESDGDLTKVNTLDGHTAQTGDSYARIGSPAGADIAADIATRSSHTVADIWDRVLTGATHNIPTSAGRRLRGIQEFQGYEGGAIWIDTINGSAGTVDYENGTVENPVDTIADANTLSTSLGINRFFVMAGSNITFVAAQENQQFESFGAFVDLNSQSMSGSHFSNFTISGNDSGTNAIATLFSNCYMQGNILGLHVFKRCTIKGNMGFGEAGDYLWDGCSSFVAGTATPSLDFGAALNASNFSVRHNSGGIEVLNMGAGSGSYSMSLEGHGQLIINANCSATSTIAIRGNFTVTDNASGAVTLSDNARYDIDQITDAVIDDDTKLDGSAINALSANDPGSSLATIANQTLIYDRIGSPVGADISADIATRSSHTAADIWAVGARTLTSFGALVADIWNRLTSALTTAGSIGKLLDDNLNATISSRSTLSTSDVKNEADDALSDIHLDHLLAVDYDPASKPGVATALLNELIESDGGVSRYTANALEQAPSGTGGDATEAKQDTIITHLTEVKGAGFIESTDSLEAIIDTGNANWGGSAASYVGAQGGQLLNFRVNEKSGSFIYDKIHSDYKGILEDGVTFEEGVKGKSLTFDGTGSVECQQNFDEKRYSGNPVIPTLTGEGGDYAPYGLYDPSILFVGDEMWIYYSAVEGGVDDYIREGLSISKDGGLTFEAYGMVLDVGAEGEWDDWKAHDVDVLYDETDSTYKMWYTGNKGPAGGGKIGLATSPDGKVWTKYAGNPVFDVDVPGTWDDGGVSYPSVLEEGGTFYMFYGGYDDTQHNGMGLATSPDGITWTRAQSTPVIPLTNYMKYTVTEKNGVYYVIFAKRFSYQELYMGYSTDKINWIINWNQVMRIGESSEWDDGAIEDADFYFDGTDAKIYYSGARTKSVDNQIGLITIENLEDKVQKAEILNQYPISICCWIKTTDATSPVGIIKKGLQSTPDIWNVYMFEGRLRAFYVPNNSNNIQMITVSDDGGIINDGLWHHIIFIVDASGGELFVDLVSKNTKAWTGTPEAITSTEFMLIGEYDVTYSTIITGSIDDIRIYDHALSSDERRGIYMGVPYLEDNTLENIREQETIGNSIDETKGVNFNTDTDSLKAIVETGNADWITGDGLSGSNAITINIKDQNTDNVVACAVEIWDQANTVFYERKITNSNGDTSYNIDNGTYTVRIHKAGYIFSDKTLIVTDAEIVNYTGTTVIIGTPAAADACRVYDYAFQSDGLTPVATIEASCFISVLPYDYSDKIHSGERRDGIYDSSTGLLYFDLARGSTVKFRVKHFGYMNKTKTIPDLDQARLTDL